MAEHPLKHLARLRDEDPELQAEYDRQKPHYEAVRALLRARQDAGLTQTELAERMEVSQAVVSRLERGRHSPNLATLSSAAVAMGYELRVEFVKQGRGNAAPVRVRSAAAKPKSISPAKSPRKKAAKP